MFVLFAAHCNNPGVALFTPSRHKLVDIRSLTREQKQMKRDVHSPDITFSNIQSEIDSFRFSLDMFL